MCEELRLNSIYQSRSCFFAPYIQRLIDYKTNQIFVKDSIHTGLHPKKLKIEPLPKPSAPSSAPSQGTMAVASSQGCSTTTWGDLKALFCMCKSMNSKVDKLRMTHKKNHKAEKRILEISNVPLEVYTFCFEDNESE